MIVNTTGRFNDWLLVATTLLTAFIALPRAAADDWHFDDVERIVAISDVHGDYDAMLATLREAGVLDDALGWSGASSHLVITGDLLDRGPDSRRVMDLIRQLEPLAAADGGAVHLLLGNHEVMNLVGDLRYVAIEEYAAFTDDELAEDRERWFQWHLDRQMIVTDAEAERKAWDDRHPPGFFGHRHAFRSDGDYGQWLMQKPIIVVINGTAFVHGGLSPKVADLGLAGVNGRLKSELVEYVKQVERLNDAGLLDPAENFYQHATALEALPADTERAEAIVAAIQTVLRLSDADIHAPDSPLWYRGNVGCGPLIEIDRIEAALEAIGAHRVVIGHTPTLTRQVLSRLGGKVVEIDTGMLNAFYDGTGNALLIDGKSLNVVSEDAGGGGPVDVHPRRVGLRDASIDADRLQEILERGDVEVLQETNSGTTAVKLTHAGDSVSATFIPMPRGGRGFVPELAAYRLDRRLELDMVPVTVSRELNGNAGVLQFLPDAIINETRRKETGRGASAWCPLTEQWNAMYIFDALVHNLGRTQDQMLYSQDNWQLMLTSHGRSFENKRSRPVYLKDVVLDIGGYWQRRLEALTDDVINEDFAETLDKRRRRALGQRRDALLEDAQGGGGNN